MKLSELLKEWEKDSFIDERDLSHESLKTPKLHAKYWRYLTIEAIEYEKLREELKRLKRLKYEYYCGLMDESEMREHGWKPFPLKILKSEVDKYIDSDEDIQNLVLKIAVQKEKIEFLESVIKQIMNRPFVIKNSIEFLKYQNGI